MQNYNVYVILIESATYLYASTACQATVTVDVWLEQIEAGLSFRFDRQERPDRLRSAHRPKTPTGDALSASSPHPSIRSLTLYSTMDLIYLHVGSSKTHTRTAAISTNQQRVFYNHNILTS